MSYEFKLPDIGEGLVEGEITKWMVKPGDFVKEDQSLCEVMTDKATVEIPSPVTGKILELKAKEGQVVPVHSTIVVIDKNSTGGASAVDAKKPAPANASSAPANGGGAKKAVERDFDDIPLFSPTKAPEPIRKATAPAPAAKSVPTATATISRLPDGRVLAAPATRRLARELGIDIRGVQGGGPLGRVTPDDLRKAGSGGIRPASLQFSIPTVGVDWVEGERREPLRGLRRKISEAMVKSKQTAPHYSFFEEADLTELVRFRNMAKGMAEERGVKLTFMPFFVKAVVEALKKFPLVNTSFDEVTNEIVYKSHYHIGIATATEAGLVVPVIKHADKKNFLEIAADVQRLAAATRAGSAALDDLRGSTFTLTNVGVIGGLASTPIINQPNVGIMGIHSIKKKPWVVDNQIVIRDIMIVSMSFDHRIVDGAVGAEFTKEVIKYLENPAAFLLAGI